MENGYILKNASDNLIIIFIYFDVHVIRLSIFIGTLYSGFEELMHISCNH